MFSFFKRKPKEQESQAVAEVESSPQEAVVTELAPTEAVTPEPTEVVPVPVETATKVAVADEKPEAKSAVVITPAVADEAKETLVTGAEQTLTEVVKEKSTEERKGFFGRLWQQLARTREKLGDNLKSLLTGRKVLDADTRDELETLLLTADLGLETTDRLLEKLSKVRLTGDQDLMQALAEIMADLLTETQQKPEIIPQGEPRVILMVGVNGVGKTTTIAKLSHHFLQDGKKLLLAAGDTFRAAAVEQIKTWGDRHQVAVITQGQGADAASVLHDALSAAKARGVDVLIGDTAGRLHTQQHLMDELKKIRRVMNRVDAQCPHEIWLVVDATTGQNAVNQAIAFHQAVGLTGIVLTKLDGTAKGGIVFSLVEQLGIPIRYIGIGESAEDLRPFEPQAFVRALLGMQDKE